MPSVLRRILCALVTTTLATTLAAQGPWRMPAAVAQGTDEGIDLSLVAQPLWHEDGDDLALRLRIANNTTEPLEGFVVQVVAFDRVSSRTALHDSFEEVPDDFIGLDFEDYLHTRVGVGQSVVVSMKGSLGTLTLSSDDPSGIYPLQISLQSLPANETLDSITSEILYYPTTPSSRLSVVPVVPLSEVPARAPGGHFVAQPEGRRPLEEAIGASGWLSRLISSLGAHKRLRLGIAPTPRLIEELADMGDGFLRENGERTERVGGDHPAAEAATELLGDLEALLQRPGVQPLLVPYSAPDLPALARVSPTVDSLREQLDEAGNVLSDTLGLALGADLDKTWIFPPAGRLDEPALEALQGELAPPGGPLKTFFSAGSLEQPNDPSTAGCPRRLLTFACPVSIETLEGRTTGFVGDSGLQDRFAALVRPGDDRLELQRLFAETAMIQEEIPGVSGRVVHFTVPSVWHPSPRVLEKLLGGLERAPWLRTRAPNEALAGAAPLPARDVIDSADPLTGEPDTEYFGAIAQAADRVESFSTIYPPAGLIERMQRDILTAQSRLWWKGLTLLERGRSYATETEEEVWEHLRNIEVGGRAEITLTSRRQAIPLVLFNDNSFDVRVKIRLRSASLDFRGGSSVLEQEIPVPVGNKPFTVPATALSSGEFPLYVSLTTRDDALVLGEQRIRVRSTEFNKIALGVTVGALAFLVLFYALRFIRQRQTPSGEDAPGTTNA
ncbi:hypothetical protein BH24ACT26_BH24ACT26_00420 [soil metagenome]